MAEEVVCPYCGSYDCEKKTSIAEDVLEGAMMVNPLLRLGKKMWDNYSQPQPKTDLCYVCNECEAEFTMAESRQYQNKLRKLESVKESIKQSYNNDQYDKAIANCNTIINSYDYSEDDKGFAYYYKGLSLKQIALSHEWNDDMPEEKREKEEQQREKYLNEALVNLENAGKIWGPSPELYYDMACILYFYPTNFENSTKDYLGRRYAIAAMESGDLDTQNDAKSIYEDFNRRVFVDFDFHKDFPCETEQDRQMGEMLKFSNNEAIPFSDRQFIMFAQDSTKLQGYYDPNDMIKWVFTLNHIPSDLHIEGFPQPGILYMANPVKPFMYFPADNAEEEIFDDKIREFEYLMCCLGATSIKFRSLKGRKISEEESIARNGGIDVGVKLVNVGAKIGTYSKDSFDSVSSREIGRSQTFNPTIYPYCPEDELYWYHHTAAWKSFVKKRLEGDQLSFTYTFKTSESSNLSRQRKLDVAASFNNLMVKVNANYSQEKNSVFSTQEETEWAVEVTFKSLKDFDKNQPQPEVQPQTKVAPLLSAPQADNQLTADEKYYLDELKDVLADGEITENDRKRLERRRIRLNISEERAKELEQLLGNNLTADEQEYYDEMVDVLEDGIIDEKERRSLDRLKRSLNLSDARAKEIEAMVRNNK